MFARRLSSGWLYDRFYRKTLDGSVLCRRAFARARSGFRPGGDSVLNHSYDITHYYHSGFSVAGGDTLLVFDYWRGEEGELTEDLQLTPARIRSFAHVIVFISHEHIDHFDPVVFSWKDLTDVSYIVSSDMPVGTRGKRMAPGDVYAPVDGVNITAYDSTDLGVSFLVDFRGLRLFHAGDLNFWHWREESTMQDIEEADAEFRKAVAPLSAARIDVAFFPVDPRQGTMYEAGANYFILTVKPRILIPMHYFHRADVALEYARTATCRSTEVIAMPVYGESMTLEEDEDGYFNIQMKEAPRAEEETTVVPAVPDEAYPEQIPAESMPPESAPAEPPADEPPAYSAPAEASPEADPFDDSDLPVSQLSESGEEDV